jgi:hypothetical protein
MVLGTTPVGGTMVTSVPMAVDVSADGMRKKSKALKGTTVSYSGVKTSSQGLLTGAKTEKKTLLGRIIWVAYYFKTKSSYFLHHNLVVYLQH